MSFGSDGWLSSLNTRADITLCLCHGDGRLYRHRLGAPEVRILSPGARVMPSKVFSRTGAPNFQACALRTMLFSMDAGSCRSQPTGGSDR